MVETIPKATELLLTGSIPHIELQCPSVCVELKRMHLNTHSRNILLLEFTLYLHNESLKSSAHFPQGAIEAIPRREKRYKRRIWNTIIFAAL